VLEEGEAVGMYFCLHIKFSCIIVASKSLWLFLGPQILVTRHQRVRLAHCDDTLLQGRSIGFLDVLCLQIVSELAAFLNGGWSTSMKCDLAKKLLA